MFVLGGENQRAEPSQAIGYRGRKKAPHGGNMVSRVHPSASIVPSRP
jgi:hypothetical protein